MPTIHKKETIVAKVTVVDHFKSSPWKTQRPPLLLLLALFHMPLPADLTYRLYTLELPIIWIGLNR